jgi:hypothetical protein
MKDNKLCIRISTKRLNKLREYATNQDKSMTQIISDWIDKYTNSPKKEE